MRRTRWRNIKVPNELARARPWLLDPCNSDDGGNVVYHKKYGSATVIIRSDKGVLTEREAGVFYALFTIAQGRPDTRITFTVAQLLDAMGSRTNPYTPAARQSLAESLERLLNATITLRIKDGDYVKKGRFQFIQGMLDYDERGLLIQGNVTISGYLEEIGKLKLGYHWLRPSIYYSLHGSVARALYSFLVSQRAIYTGGEYRVRLSKLCQFINYERKERPWWRVWSNTIRPALTQIQKAGVVQSFTLDKQSHKEDGGLVTVVGTLPQPKPVQAQTTQAGKYGEIERMIREELDSSMLQRAYQPKKLYRALEELEHRLDLFGVHLIPFVRAYLQWIQFHPIKYFSPVLFKPDNAILQQFMHSNSGKDYLQSALWGWKSYQVDTVVDLWSKPEEEIKQLREEMGGFGPRPAKPTATAKPDKSTKKNTKPKPKPKRPEDKGTCPYGRRFARDFEPLNHVCTQCEKEHKQTFEFCDEVNNREGFWLNDEDDD